jgi:hypothetical protein
MNDMGDMSDLPYHEPKSIRTPHGDFFVTKAYLLGAYTVQEGRPYSNPFKPGPELAQYNYGYANEKHGYHDDQELE